MKFSVDDMRKIENAIKEILNLLLLKKNSNNNNKNIHTFCSVYYGDIFEQVHGLEAIFVEPRVYKFSYDEQNSVK
jgi:hypothetical protein